MFETTKRELRIKYRKVATQKLFTYLSQSLSEEEKQAIREVLWERGKLVSHEESDDGYQPAYSQSDNHQ